ncbi:MAG: low molecular weight protein-tyrosine-phosphatase [Eubacteriales bacterium]
MIRVLMVCHGNICRSTMAEFVLKDMVNKRGLGDVFYIASAGTSSEEIGNDTHRGTRKKLTEMGIPFARREAVQVTRKDYDKYDYLICMDKSNVRNLGRIIGEDWQKKVHLLLEFAGENRDIADPWYTGNFDETYRDVEEGCVAFINGI